MALTGNRFPNQAREIPRCIHAKHWRIALTRCASRFSCQDAALCIQAILAQGEQGGLRTIPYGVGHFPVTVARQVMHNPSGLRGVSHELFVNLELGIEDLECLFFRNAKLVIVHNAGIEEIGFGGIFIRILGADNLAVAILGCLRTAFSEHFFGGPELLRASANHANTETGEQRQVVHEDAVKSIGAIAEPHEGAIGKLLALGLALNHRDEVGDNLGGVMLLLATEAVGLEFGARHAANHRHGGVRNNLVDNALREAANHDGVSHGRDDSRGLGDILLARSGMQGATIEEHCVAAELLHGGFEAHASTRRLLVEHHGERNVLQQRQANALLLHFLHQQANIKQFVNLVHGPVAKTVHVHVVLVLHNPHSFSSPSPLGDCVSLNPFPWDSVIRTLRRSRGNPQLAIDTIYEKCVKVLFNILQINQGVIKSMAIWGYFPITPYSH